MKKSNRWVLSNALFKAVAAHHELLLVASALLALALAACSTKPMSLGDQGQLGSSTGGANAGSATAGTSASNGTSNGSSNASGTGSGTTAGTSTGATIGGTSGTTGDTQTSPTPCSPLTPVYVPITLQNIVAIGKHADGTVYVIDQGAPDMEYRAFVSQGSTLQRVPVAGSGSGSTGNQPNTTFVVLSITDTTAPFTLKAELTGTTVTAMGVIRGPFAGRDFTIGTMGDVLQVVGNDAIANLAVVNLTNKVNIDFVGTLSNGDVFVVTSPEYDNTDASFRAFYGPPNRVVERAVVANSVSRSSAISLTFVVDGVQVAAYLPSPLFAPGAVPTLTFGAQTPETLTVGDSDAGVAGFSFLCTQASGVTCTPPPISDPAAACVPGPASQICTAGSQGTTCTSACNSSDYGMTCNRNDAGRIPDPDPSLNCRILPVPTPSNVLFYCCPCAGPTGGDLDGGADADATPPVDATTPSSCDTQREAISSLALAAVSTADQQCTTDVDCVVPPALHNSCYTGCSPGPVSSSGATSVQNEIDAIDRDQCQQFLKSGCTPLQPVCPAPIQAVCRAGQCVASPTASAAACNGDLTDGGPAPPPADNHCTVDNDCTVVEETNRCRDACYSAPVSQAGAATLRDRLARAEEDYCPGFFALGCKLVAPPCPPPNPVSCREGTCVMR